MKLAILLLCAIFGVCHSFRSIPNNRLSSKSVNTGRISLQKLSSWSDISSSIVSVGDYAAEIEAATGEEIYGMMIFHINTNFYLIDIII